MAKLFLSVLASSPEWPRLMVAGSVNSGWEPPSLEGTVQGRAELGMEPEEQGPLKTKEGTSGL